jgi:hypothetical protein
MISAFELDAIYMEEKMSNRNKIMEKKPLFWLVVIVAVFVAAATVYAILPVISLDSATSFPVDI